MSRISGDVGGPFVCVVGSATGVAPSTWGVVVTTTPGLMSVMRSVAPAPPPQTINGALRTSPAVDMPTSPVAEAAAVTSTTPSMPARNVLNGTLTSTWTPLAPLTPQGMVVDPPGPPHAGGSEMSAPAILAPCVSTKYAFVMPGVMP